MSKKFRWPPHSCITSLNLRTMTELSLISTTRCFNGLQQVFSHESKELKCKMSFSVYIPIHKLDVKLPVLYYLSGLTCTEMNFINKSGFQRFASKHGIIVIGPDTSPRNCNIEGENERWDFGTGAGFYVDATQEKWKENYRMYSYICNELPELIDREFPTNGKMSICGHSMGGHGAMVMALRNPEKYKSVSAFAPICNPLECEWGKYSFTHYLGEDKEDWKKYDTTELVKSYDGPPMEILIDQGTTDVFYKEGQLLPKNLIEASKDTKVDVKVHLREGYDHGYYFISTFIEDHFEHHARHLL